MHGITSCVVREDPRLFSTHKKVTIVFFVILAGAIPGLSSTIYFPGLPEITKDLHASPISVTASTSLFILFQGIFPILWSSLSDYFHIRKVLYIISLMIFTMASLGCCFAQDIWTLVALRCIQAIGASANALGAGTISDLYPVEKRGTAMGLMFFGLYVGPLVGPNIGGGLTYHWSWRATFWFCFIYAATACIGMMLFTVETYRPANFSAPPTTLQPSPSELPLKPAIDLEELGVENNNDVELKAKANESTSNTDGLAIELGTTPAAPPHITKKSFNPIQSLLFLRYHFVYPVAICTGVAFGVMFTLETIMPELFQKNYHLNSWQIGLCYLGGGLGNIVGSIFGGKYIDYALVTNARARGRVLPEDRLAAPVFASGFVILPLGSLLFTWGIAGHLHLSVPILGFALVCFGMTQVLLAGSTYLVDATGKGASATAAANCVRNVLACVLSFVASPMLQHMSVGYIGVLAAVLSWIVTVGLVMNKLRGEEWRKAAGFTQAPS